MKPRYHAKAKPTRHYHRSVVTSILMMRETLDGLDADGFCRSHGLTRPEFDAMLATERKRRAAL